MMPAVQRNGGIGEGHHAQHYGTLGGRKWEDERQEDVRSVKNLLILYSGVVEYDACTRKGWMHRRGLPMPSSTAP